MSRANRLLYEKSKLAIKKGAAQTPLMSTSSRPIMVKIMPSPKGEDITPPKLDYKNGYTVEGVDIILQKRSEPPYGLEITFIDGDLMPTLVGRVIDIIDHVSTPKVANVYKRGLMIDRFYITGKAYNRMKTEGLIE